MLEVYFWPTSNGKKITIMLEEIGLPYRVVPVNINKGDQFTPEFEALNPNQRMPVLVDDEVVGGRLVVFESGAILQYLAEKTGKLLPTDLHGKYRVLQWVNWQMGGLGPIAGQAHHFFQYAPMKVEYAMHRFRGEATRLYKVMDKELGKHQHLAGDDYSIADIAAWPWVYRHEWQQQNLDDFPNVKRWFKAVGARPAVARGANVGAEWLATAQAMSDEDKKRLFNFRDEDIRKRTT
ncbi:MAG: glutathione S-transferase N-terminal domain-containing protein [Gammaproteobacteria bacterium]